MTEWVIRLDGPELSATLLNEKGLLLNPMTLEPKIFDSREAAESYGRLSFGTYPGVGIDVIRLNP